MNPNTLVDKRANARTRLFSLGMLAVFAGAAATLAVQGYHAATDAFVAPVILSPDSDVVLQTKLKISELAVERSRIGAEISAIDADVAACEEAVRRLRALAATAASAAAWTRSVNAEQVTAGDAESRKLKEQRVVLESMLARQSRQTEEARRNQEASLITKADYMREAHAQSEIELALLENDRSQVQVNLGMHQAVLGARSLARVSGAPTMPEIALHEDQAVRLELEVLKLETEQRTKRAARGAIVDKLAKIDEVEAKLRGRPAVQAMEQSVNLAFVPYTQIDGVRAGGRVQDCLWGLFFCKDVGSVSRVVAGEVVLPDPWGNQARGQFVVLELIETRAAKSKTLRVRGGGGGDPPSKAPPESSPMVSVK